MAVKQTLTASSYQHKGRGKIKKEISRCQYYASKNNETKLCNSSTNNVHSPVIMDYEHTL
ncbi:MAG: hypothetical protein QMC80_04500 [Thermoplasmatales archaeon]|nr:hypothetical protein [Thermoplasmatales archaeon]